MKALSVCRKSFKTVVGESPWIVKCLLFVFTITYLTKTFIFVTTNSLYNPDITQLLKPVRFLVLGCIGISCLITFLYFFRKALLTNYFIVIFAMILLVNIGLGTLIFEPCFFEHSNSFQDHIHPHTNAYILKQSFLCPSYSNRSILHLLFWGSTSFLILAALVASTVKKQKSF